jgi:hypothetical protein
LLSDIAYKALVPPPRSHRHRYIGVLAPNSPLRAAVIALAPVAVIAPSLPLADAEEKSRRAASHYLWAMLLARIHEAFPLNCPICQARFGLSPSSTRRVT